MFQKTTKGTSSVSLNSINNREAVVQLLQSFKESVEPSIDRILDGKIDKFFKLEEKARGLVFDKVVELVCAFVLPRPPSTLHDAEIRLQSLRCLQTVVKPSSSEIEAIRANVVRGRRSKLALPVDKLLAGYRGINAQVDPSVFMFVMAVVENVVGTCLSLGVEYHRKVSQKDDKILRAKEMQVIFAKYNNPSDMNQPVYDLMDKLTKQFTQDFKDNIKTFLIFLRDCREQLEVIIKIFKQPLEFEENVQNVFGNIGDVLDHLGFIVETLDDSTDSTVSSFCMNLFDLAEMEMFEPFERFVENVIINGQVKDNVSHLLKSDSVVDKLLRHYDMIISLVFDKKRKAELMVKYRILHHCDFCRNPLKPSRIRNNSFSLSSPADERRSEDSGYASNLPVNSSSLAINSFVKPISEFNSSSSSSFTDSSDSPRPTRGPSPMDIESLHESSPSSQSSHLARGSRAVLCNTLINSFRYLLPRLLLLPVFQFMYIYKILQAMSSSQNNDIYEAIDKPKYKENESRNQEKDETNEEVKSLIQVVGLLTKHFPTFDKALMLNEQFQTEIIRLQPFFKIGSSLEYTKDSNNKLSEIKSLVKKEPDNWEWPTSGASDFIMEGPVQLRVDTKKALVDRYMYMFSNMLLLCKKQSKKGGLVGGPILEIKMKQRINLEQFHIQDELEEVIVEGEVRYTFMLEFADRKEGSTTEANQTSFKSSVSNMLQFGRDVRSFAGSTQTLTSLQTLTDSDVVSIQGLPPSGSIEAVPRQSLQIYLASQEDKTDWLASLLQIQTRKLFSQFTILRNKEEIPLRLPNPVVYKFAEPNTEFNIEYETDCIDNSADIPVVRAATLEKLISHLTSHSFCDGKTLNSFLLIFRNFTTPMNVLHLLIERFDIPDPEFTELERRPPRREQSSTADKMLKKFRTSYKRKVQLRVVNFLHKWVNCRSYFKADFASNPEMIEKLQEFFGRQIGTPHLSMKIQAVQKAMNKQLNERQVSIIIQMQQQRPPISNCILCSSSKELSVFNIHPLELARQITLFEWNLYSKIEFWEIHGRESQEGPNFRASMEFSNKMLYWLIFEIIRQRNLQDRICAIFRIVDLMQIFEEFNNLQGAQECKGALISASVHRLKDTFEAIPTKYKLYRNVIDKIRTESEENSDSYIANYQKKIHAISAPALPYIAMGDKTHLIHMDLKNPNFFKKSKTGAETTVELINFWKFRQMSELIEHYMSFQTTPYNFHEVPMVQEFLQQLNPFLTVKVNDHYEFDDYVHERSLEIQPKVGEAAQYNERHMTDEELRLSNILNGMTTISDKMNDDIKKANLIDSAPPALPPKLATSGVRSRRETPEPAVNVVPTLDSQLESPPTLPERRSRKEGSQESNVSQSESTSNVPNVVSGTSVSNAFFQQPVEAQEFEGMCTRPPPVASRSQSREHRTSPPPPLPPKRPPRGSKFYT